MNVNYFRYLMTEKGVDSGQLAEIFGVSRGHINYKILHKKFNVNEIKQILELFEMKFEEVFIDENKD